MWWSGCRAFAISLTFRINRTQGRGDCRYRRRRQRAIPGITGLNLHIAEYLRSLLSKRDAIQAERDPQQVKLLALRLICVIKSPSGVGEDILFKAVRGDSMGTACPRRVTDPGINIHHQSTR